jgi:hypothetical protein
LRRCFGITRNLTRCNREGNWKLFCKEHQKQPVVWVTFLVFTVFAGSASIYSALQPLQKPTKSENGSPTQILSPGTSYSDSVPESAMPLRPDKILQQKTEGNERQDKSKDRPYFALLKTELKTTSPSQIRFRIRNTGNRVADKLSDRLIIVDQQFQKKPFISDWSTANEVPPDVGKVYLEEVQIPPIAAPAFVIFAIRYGNKSMSVQQPFCQVWYLRWAGTENGILSLDFGDASIAEREDILKNLGKELRDYLECRETLGDIR